MINQLKKALYFPLANYFKFFANIRLRKWKPRIIVVTGSSGKTTLLHLIESQLGSKAKYSHHANSAYGIPFDILGLHRSSLMVTEWPILLLTAPFKAFKKPPLEEFYVVEADCDRPNEGKFLASFLKPEICLWVSVSKTHSMNFEKKETRKNRSLEEVIAYEFGYFLEYTSKMSIVNGDSNLIEKQIKRTKSQVLKITKADYLEKYDIAVGRTEFKISSGVFSFPFILPEEVFYSIAMCVSLIKYLGITIDKSFQEFSLPPSRNSFFKGMKGTILVDSSYNANLSSMEAILKMFGKVESKAKWAVIGDMLEQGGQEKEEHEKLADIIASIDLDRVILMGPRVSNFTYPKLKSQLNDIVVIEKFINPKQVLDYLEKNIKSGETIVFKGARFLEGVIEHLLENKEDSKKLCRREKVWEKRRKKWGL